MEETLPVLDEVEVPAVAIYSVTAPPSRRRSAAKGGQTASSSATRLRTWF